jgi:hypothetical protein
MYSTHFPTLLLALAAVVYVWLPSIHDASLTYLQLLFTFATVADPNPSCIAHVVDSASSTNMYTQGPQAAIP